MSPGRASRSRSTFDATRPRDACGSARRDEFRRVGTIIEWYDFLIYGTAAALVFNTQFFPSIDPLAGTLASLATYSVGFVARPIGGAIFGHFGDRIGRKITLMITMVIMALVTFAVERGWIRRGPERNHCVSLGGRSL